MTPLVSVIIAVYNGEQHIEECLNSILCQTFQQWECIIVNDGSTDKTPSIIDRFVAQDARFSSYTLTPNSGFAKISFEKGLTYAKAEWVFRIDHDDYIDTDALEKLYYRALDTKADTVITRMIFFEDSNPKESYPLPSSDFPMDQIITGREAVLLTIPNWKIGLNGTLSKRHLLISSANNATHMSVEEYESRELLMISKTVAFVDTNYYYRQHPQGISKKPAVKLFHYLITDKMLEEFIQKHFDETHVYEFRLKRFHALIYFEEVLYKSGRLMSKNDRREAKRIIKKHYLDLDKKQIYKNSIKKRLLYTQWYVLFRFAIHHPKFISIIRKVFRKLYKIRP